MAEAKCPSCGGQRLTMRKNIAASGYGLATKFDVDDGSWMGGTVRIKMECVVCGDCGHVMLFSAADSLADLQKNWDKIK